MEYTHRLTKSMGGESETGMAVQEASDVEVSEQYEGLSPKRQVIVDTWAELYHETGEEPQNVTVVKEADSDPSYVSQTLSEHKDIARARYEQLENQREEGEETTTGDPFEGQLEPDQGSYQSIKERPTKGQSDQQDSEDTETSLQMDTVEEEDTTKAEVPEDSQDERFTYAFSREEVEQIIEEGELPKEVRNNLLSEVVRRAFED